MAFIEGGIDVDNWQRFIAKVQRTGNVSLVHDDDPASYQQIDGDPIAQLRVDMDPEMIVEAILDYEDERDLHIRARNKKSSLVKPNADRVKTAELILRKYANLAGMSLEDDQEEVLVDLLADLCHFAHGSKIIPEWRGFDEFKGTLWERAVQIAQNHCESEI